MRLVRVANQTRGTMVAENVELASTSLTRLWGLLGRSGVEAGGGLWIVPSSGVHTMGMRFAIDVLGLDKNLRVMKVWHRLAPFRVTAVSLKMHSVIELAAGEIQKRAVEVGDVLQMIVRPNVPQSLGSGQKLEQSVREPSTSITGT